MYAHAYAASARYRQMIHSLISFGRRHLFMFVNVLYMCYDFSFLLQDPFELVGKKQQHQSLLNRQLFLG